MSLIFDSLMWGNSCDRIVVWKHLFLVDKLNDGDIGSLP